MRIFDEKQLYQAGDVVVTQDGITGVVCNIMTNSVYYEARPIASYTQYTYVIQCDDGHRLYLKSSEIVPPPT